MANCYRLFAKALPLSTLICNYWTINHTHCFNVIADDNDTQFNDEAIHEFITNFNKWTYPIKPDRAEIRKFLNFLEMLPQHKNVLIIGSNPALRDMAFITEKNITCCDYNKYKMELMRDNMKYKKYVNNKNEQLIECDLLNMNENEMLSNQKYDLILSIDGHLNSLPFEQWDKFLMEICDRLKFTGFFILKIMNKTDGYLHRVRTLSLSPEQIVEDWVYSKYKNDCGYLFIHLLMYLYHNDSVPNNSGINCSDVIKLVCDRCDEYKWEWSDQQKTEFFDKFGYFKENKYIFYCNEEDIVNSSLSDAKFYFQQICYGNDDSNKYKFTPIYVLGKQSSRTGGEPRLW